MENREREVEAANTGSQEDRAAGDDQRSGTIDRREFVRSVGAAGLAGALGAGGGLAFPSPLAADSRGLLRAQDPEFPTPEGLRPGAQSDSRFPVSFQEPVTEGLRLVLEYFTALSQRDLDGIANTLHFPFAIYEDIEPVVIESASDLLSRPPPTLNGTGSGRSAIMPGSYDLLEGVDVHLYCPVGGVFSLAFKRYTPDGHKLLDCEGIYSVTNNDGRWAIQMASTIFHERGYEGLEYPLAEEMELLGSQGYLAAFGYGDEETLNNPQIGRGSYEPPLPPGTPVASVSFGYGPRDRTQNARDGRPMDGWRTRGVTSRLNVREATEPGPPGSLETNLDEFADLAGQTVGEYGYTRARRDQPTIIHATHDKAHTNRGYWRFTPTGELISETRSVGISIYVQGAWRGAGGMGQVTHHDRSNSVG